ncbi:transketolase [Helicobacter bilis]|uniref:Transketolase n=1 Tax=Helicobacter bilis TaxID=37372 RepID=A0A4U8U7U3_9HELI|nr:transketolase [Helicobacter bilis]MCI7411007.1 transketolase [Helicobacter bilis]MDD7296451.1 transketolase [Helicobacter bilis]MDY4399953.1 transketolase [Helicobacter bilis]TLE09432.1 transketolase [Helicobacter bilis]
MTHEQIANELRMLCADMVQEANSGHPGAPMGLADIAVVLANHINIYPREANWINRDRLVFSGGHASALLYALLHLWGYDIDMQDLRNFRKLHSKTPGHPEYKHTHGVEITTGPLGQGVANAVGFAMAAKRARAMLGGDVINHKVYCFCGDGDLEEGISYEACSLAGHHGLDNLILIYDSNNISIEGDINIAFSEDIGARFRAQGFFVLEICGHDYMQINNAFLEAKQSCKPTLIIAKTKIAKNAIGLEGSHHAHGAPLGHEVILESKKQMGFSSEAFRISEESRTHFKETAIRGEKAYQAWLTTLQKSGQEKNLEMLLKKDFSNVSFPMFNSLDSNHANDLQKQEGRAGLAYQNAIATRASNGKILNAIAQANMGFIGGSADLAPSNNTTLKDSKDFPHGNNMHFGVREHAMGAISNAFANYGIFTPFCATFFVFSDYLSPSIRVASLMKAQVFYIFTHDSIGVGEDGATHQPIEQLSHLRAMPNLLNWRVADANENALAWQVALTLQTPQSFILTRQNLPLVQSDFMTLDNVSKGAYIISRSLLLPDFTQTNSNMKKVTLLASGSEVHLAIKAQEKLENEGIATQVVSMPCFELFLQQGRAYSLSLFGDSKVFAIEAQRGLELYRFADGVLSMESFGASGKGDLLFEHFGFSVENICNNVKSLFA